MNFPAVEATAAPDWIVAFCDPEPLPPGAPLRNRVLTRALRTLLKPGFRHCYAMRPLALADGWLVFNPHSLCIDVWEEPGDAAIRRLAAAVAAGRARWLRVAARRPLAWAPRGVATCVSAVAHLLGAPSRPWTTPYRFYRSLQQEESAMGGMFSSPDVDTSASETAAREARAEADELKRKNAAKLRLQRAGQSGRSLLAFSDSGETGVKTTLGAG